jgi:MYXO-CTERM domain-containing protein
MFQGSDWIANNRLASVPAGMTIAPGASYTFAWTFTVPPGTPVGMYDEHFGVVEDGVAWFGDPGERGPSDSTIEVIIEVTEGPDSGTPIQNDAAVVPGNDAGMVVMGDADHADGGSILGTDSGTPVMSRGIAGGCGCRAAGTRSSAGGLLAAMAVSMLLVMRRRKARA